MYCIGSPKWAQKSGKTSSRNRHKREETTNCFPCKAGKRVTMHARTPSSCTPCGSQPCSPKDVGMVVHACYTQSHAVEHATYPLH